MSPLRLPLLVAAALAPLAFSAPVARAQPRPPAGPLRALAAGADLRADRDAAGAAALATRLSLRPAFEEAGARYALVRADGGLPVYLHTLGDDEARSIAAAAVWPSAPSGYALTGAGVTVGVWDGGAPRATHRELAGRVRAGDAATALVDHTTHVAGIVAGSGLDAQARGVAYAAEVAAYDWVRDRSEMAAAAAAGLRLSNHSYGQALGWVKNARGDGRWAWLGAAATPEDRRFGLYDWLAAEWDAIAARAPHYLMVKAAGNDRGERAPEGDAYWVIDPATSQWVLTTDARPADGGLTGFTTVVDAGNAKNVLTVGAVESVADRAAAAIQTLANSAWGPTRDGRIKPDVVADGQGVYSSVAPSDASYATMSGTSMAAAATTGGLALLLEHEAKLRPGRPYRASTYRALLVHTADEAGPAPGPDYASGWGLVNTFRAAEAMADAEGGEAARIAEVVVPLGATVTVPVHAAGTGPLRVTLAWTDPAAPADAPAALVNDLDLWVTDASGTVALPWTLDPAAPAAPATRGANTRDNVEQVVVDAPAAGAYTVHVRFRAQSGAPAEAVGQPQTASLVATGLGPEALPVELVAFDGAADGDRVTLRWATASETNNAGFAVEQRGPDGWAEVAFVAGHGTTSEPHAYAHDVKALAPGRHAFRLRQRDLDGRTHVSPEVEVTVALAGVARVTAARPNPFGTRTAFAVTVARGQRVTAEAYDLLGRHVATVFDGEVAPSAPHPLAFDGADLPAGVYVLRVRGEAFAHTQRVVLAR